MTFLSLEHEIRDLLVEHQFVCKLIDEIDRDQNCSGTEVNTLRVKYVDRARYLKNLAEVLYKKQRKVAAEEVSNENESVEDLEISPEKLSFLNALNLKPKTSLDEPSNRKSRRNRIPATKHVVTYGDQFKYKTDSKSPTKKRLLRKRPADEYRPSSTPNISNGLPSRFITETLVVCEECRRPFKIHHVNNLNGIDNVTTTRNVCFACQVSIDTEQMINSIIDQTTLHKTNSVGPPAVIPQITTTNEIISSSQNVSRASSPGYICE